MFFVLLYSPGNIKQVQDFCFLETYPSCADVAFHQQRLFLHMYDNQGRQENNVDAYPYDHISLYEHSHSGYVFFVINAKKLADQKICRESLCQIVLQDRWPQNHKEKKHHDDIEYMQVLFYVL